MFQKGDRIEIYNYAWGRWMSGTIKEVQGDNIFFDADDRKDWHINGWHSISDIKIRRI